ncbi:hypothetical protein SAMN04488123_13113 [Natribacillus halophilus]|uniref:Holin-like Toxin (Hol-Tox) n=1 Tax=Natribacillus halophilus TaxID=549003 RepID=A0A1G8SM51_9BACI|nr:hypothetical protein SAMN04488123_13113 [Natribacillus halophilus]
MISVYEAAMLCIGVATLVYLLTKDANDDTKK